MADDFLPLITAASHEWNVDPTLLRAMIQQESSGKTGAVSKAGARGLTGLMPDTAKGIGVTNLADPIQQIYGGAKYLSEALDAEKTPEDALRYYHGGPDWRNSYGPESRAYAPAVTQHYMQFASAPTPSPANGAPAPAGAPDPFEAALRGTGGTSQPAPVAAPAPDPFSDLLASSQKADDAAKPVKVVPENPGVYNGDYNENDPIAAKVGTAVGNVARAGIEGVKEGFGDAPIGLTPASETDLVRAGVYNGPNEYNPLKAINRAVINPLAAGVDALLRGGSAAFRGAQNVVAQTGAELGAPVAGRDIAALPEAFMGMPGGLGVPRVPEPPPINPLLRIADEHTARLDAPLPEAFRDRPGVLTPSAVGPSSPNPLVAAAAEPPPNPLATPQPRSAGAAASRDMAVAPLPPETPAARVANLGKDVLQTAEERAGPQMVDNSVYVPGVQRTLAAREFNPRNALDEKVARESDPAFDTHLKSIEKNNNETMVDLLRSDAGDINTIKEAHDAREGVAPPAQKLFDNEAPVDAAPVVSAIDSILSGPAGKRGAVVKILNDVKSKLFDADGNLETLPSQLYGARQNITDWLKKGAGVGDIASDAKLAKGQLGDVLEALDPIINKGAPKFEAYLKDFSEASKPIDQQEFLQKYQTGPKKLTGQDGYLQLSKVQKMLDDIYQGRKASGVNPAKSLTDEQIQNIVAVRNELAANSLRDRLAAAKGSDTFQKTNRAGALSAGPLGTMVRGGAELAGHVIVNQLVDPTGLTNAAMATHRFMIAPTIAARKAAKQAAALDLRKNQLLSVKPTNALSE